MAGGPSARRLDLERLRGQRVIAVNDAILAYPRASAFFTLDGTYFCSRPNPMGSFVGWRFVALPLERFKHYHLDHEPRTVRLVRRVAPGLSEVQGIVHAGNSGFGALNLAVLLGARDIVLLGYDLNPVGDSHAFREPNGRYSRGECSKQVEQFNTALLQLDWMGVRVRNANHDSAIRCYPFCSMEDFR